MANLDFVPSETTDPARELADFFTRILRHAPHKPIVASEVYGSSMDARAWSNEYFEIVLLVRKRIALLKDIAPIALKSDPYFLPKVLEGLNSAERAFTIECMTSAWDQVARANITGETVSNIMMLAPHIRHMSYPKFDEGEIPELLEQCGNFLTWLDEHELEDDDFYRQALYDAVHSLQLKLKHLGWGGSQYVYAGMAGVAEAYAMIAQKSEGVKTPKTQAVKVKTEGFGKKFLETARIAKDVKDGAEAMVFFASLGITIGKVGMSTAPAILHYLTSGISGYLK